MDVSDAIYDHTSPYWQNDNDRVMWQRAFSTGARQQQLESQALLCADPTTPNDFIRAEMTAPEAPPQFGAMAQTSPTIEDVLAGQWSNAGNLVDRAPTDFSGTPAGVEATSFPSITNW